MSDPHKKHQELLQRRDQLKDRLARHQAREEQKREESDRIRKQLTELGVDPDKPDEERARLQAEADAQHAETKRLLDELEAELDRVEGKQTPAPAPQPAKPNPSTDDLELN